MTSQSKAGLQNVFEEVAIEDDTYFSTLKVMFPVHAPILLSGVKKTKRTKINLQP